MCKVFWRALSVQGEQGGLMEGATDVEQYEVEIVEDLMVGAAQDRPACKLRSGISLSIVAALGSSEVIGPIDFDDQGCLKAAEVDDHRTDTLLPAERGAQLAIAQCAPQLLLGCCG